MRDQRGWQVSCATSHPRRQFHYPGIAARPVVRGYDGAVVDRLLPGQGGSSPAANGVAPGRPADNVIRRDGCMARCG